ncbi:MAG: hypothetical protein A2X59_12565 [Nitrospirae bacterium GWC2_42_7]|nr:MAG: hypothetical protein A2X59_12565 [Nitrospirae bacterium GWC2_42_7]
MKALKRFFLSRKTVLWLISLILVTVVAAYFVPQRFSATPANIAKWNSEHPALVVFINSVGLDHLYTTPWFAFLLFMFFVSITLSTYEQIKVAMKKTFELQEMRETQGISINSSLEQIVLSMKKQGYMKIARNKGVVRFVKHPWSYWGSVLFHSGIVLVIASSLLIVLTQRRGQINLAEGEVFPARSPLIGEEKGILAENLLLPEAVKIEEINPEFWETDHLKHLSSVVSFIDPEGRTKKYELAINKIANYQGVRIYQGRTFGNTFLVVLSGKDGNEFRMRLDMEYPAKRDKPSYDNFEYEGLPFLLKAKYFADADKKTMDSSNPLLVLRLVNGEKIIGEVPLRLGESGQLGPYKAALVNARKWSGIILLDITGMPGIFIGFFIIIAGIGLTYFLPPSEIYLIKSGGGFSLLCRGGRFESLYMEEFEGIYKTLGGRKSE